MASFLHAPASKLPASGWLILIAAISAAHLIFLAHNCDASHGETVSQIQPKAHSQSRKLQSDQLFIERTLFKRSSEVSDSQRMELKKGFRPKGGRLILAQRPKATSSTTTSSTTQSTNSIESKEDEQANSNEDTNDSKSDADNDDEKGTEAQSETQDSDQKSAAKSEAEESKTTSTLAPKGWKSRLKAIKTTVSPTEEPVSDSEAGSRNSSQSYLANESNKMTTKLRKPMVALPFIKPKNASVCTPEAYLEFPADPVGNKGRARGLVLIHIAIVCYMFYSLALVCERYFMPSLEEFAQRLNLSQDVAGATLMSAGSSAPELFTAILGVFVAKGDVGTGAIVGSAVFNILFVIGVCSFVSTTSAQLNWWPVLRDSVFYSFTVLVLIMFIYDERVTAFESFTMIALYGLYIFIMAHNEALKAYVTHSLQSHPVTAKLIGSQSNQVDGPDEVFGSTSTGTGYAMQSIPSGTKHSSVEEDSMFLAACLVILKHKRLFSSQLRFSSAARYIIVKRQHRRSIKQAATNECNYFGPESEPLRKDHGGSSQRDRMTAYAQTGALSKNKFSIVSKDDYEFWHRPPEEGENYYLWLARIPVNYVLHYTVPDCTLYPDKYLITFLTSITWTAIFSYIMVWMVTLIGYTFGVPDSVMGVTFLAAGTSVPDCYSSIHAAKNGMADMAVSNSIGSNVFDILIGLAVPWFIQTAIYPGVVATINSRGVIYAVILLFLSLIVTIYLLNQYEWTLKPRLGLALLIAYSLFIVLTCMLEFNLFGHVNPPPCPVET